MLAGDLLGSGSGFVNLAQAAALVGQVYRVFSIDSQLVWFCCITGLLHARMGLVQTWCKKSQKRA